MKEMISFCGLACQDWGALLATKMMMMIEREQKLPNNGQSYIKQKLGLRILIVTVACLRGDNFSVIVRSAK